MGRGRVPGNAGDSGTMKNRIASDVITPFYT